MRGGALLRHRGMEGPGDVSANAVGACSPGGSGSYAPESNSRRYLHHGWPRLHRRCADERARVCESIANNLHAVLQLTHGRNEEHAAVTCNRRIVPSSSERGHQVASDEARRCNGSKGPATLETPGLAYRHGSGAGAGAGGPRNCRRT